MPSPLCEVKDGAGAYQPTTAGVNVTAGNTVTIHLIDSAAGSWSCDCVYTDDLSDLATVNAGLTRNSALRTCTFTAPVAGRTYIFRSVIEGGTKNGRKHAPYVTTFGIYVTTEGGHRVVAANEQTESGPFGWIKSINALIRGLSVVTTKIVRYIAEPKSDQRDIQIDSIVTTDATPTDLFTFATTAGRSYYLAGFIEGTTSSLAGRWLYRIEQYYDNQSGTLTARISAPTGGVTEIHETSSSLTLVADTNLQSIRVRIATGLAATTVRWRGRLFLHEGLP